MTRRRTLNSLVIGLVGLGMPAYYKIKYFLLGEITLMDIVDPSGWIDVSFAATLTALILVSHDLITDRVRSQGVVERRPIRRFAIQWAMTTAVSTLLVIAYTHFFFTVLYPSAIAADFLFDLLLLGVVIPLFVQGLRESLRHGDEIEAAGRQQERLERENAQARYRILQSQVDPHFLFNCLNTLDELLEESTDRARQFVERLAGVYRFLLDNLNHDVVGLDEELTFLDSYLYLQRSRFGNTLDVTVSISDADRRAGLVPMTLQMLFENVLKHNVASADRPLGVEISTRGGTDLIFRSERRPKRAAESFGIGLDNLRHRYRFVAGGSVDVEQTDGQFTVRLPLLEVPAG